MRRIDLVATEKEKDMLEKVAEKVKTLSGYLNSGNFNTDSEDLQY
jgi:hypothetical protein